MKRNRGDWGSGRPPEGGGAEAGTGQWEGMSAAKNEGRGISRRETSRYKGPGV